MSLSNELHWPAMRARYDVRIYVRRRGCNLRLPLEAGQADVEDDRAIAFDGHTFLKFRNRVMNR